MIKPEETIGSATIEDAQVPIKALRLTTRNAISSLLNSLKVIPNDNGLPRDWRGLAHLIGLKSEKIPVIACDSDPTARILHLWQKQDNPPCTIKQLMYFLGELDRYDIVDDIAQMIENDVELFKNEPEKRFTDVTPVDDHIDKQILTRDDVCRLNQGLDTQNYNAFVVFADEDIDFATELIDTMEKQYGLKLCVKERDLVAGLQFEYKAIIELISERCDRLIVILSPAYLKSSANKFVVDYAQALGIEQGKRKIIPCLYEPCELPQELRHIFMLNYQRSGKFYNFWERLNDSIKTPTHSPIRVNTQRPVSQEIRPTYNERLPDLKPALIQPNQNHLKIKKECVKFGSYSDLPACDETNETKRSASVNGLCTAAGAGATTSSLVTETTTTTKTNEKTKSKLSPLVYLKSFISLKDKKKTKDKDEEKDSNNTTSSKKKKFFKTKSKTPVNC